MLIFPLKNVAAQWGFFSRFHIGFRPQVVSARIDTLPIDIMLPEFAISPGSHLKTAQLSILGRLTSFIQFWPTLTTSTCLNCLGRGRSVCKVTHRRSHAFATLRECPQTKTFLILTKTGFKSNNGSVLQSYVILSQSFMVKCISLG